MISDTVDKVDSVEVVEMVAPDRVSTEDPVQINNKVKEHEFSYFNQPGSILQIISIRATAWSHSEPFLEGILVGFLFF